jgi:hypothetical protein
MAPKSSKPRSRFHLPDIETTPSRRSSIRTVEEQEAELRHMRARQQQKVAASQKAKRQADIATEKERRARVAQRSVPAPPPDATPTKATPEPEGTSPADAARKLGRNVTTQVSKMPRKALIAEACAVALITAIREVSEGHSPGLQPFVGAFVVYLVLGFAAEVGGPSTARFAAGMGGLVLLAVAASAVGPLTRAAGVIPGGSHQAGRPVTMPGTRLDARPRGTRARPDPLGG